MVVPSVLSEESLYRFLEEHGDDRVKRGLLFFWGSHPNAKFERNAIYYAQDCTKRELDGALKAMAEAGLVDTQILNGVTFYSLTANEERRRPVLELVTLNWDEWHLMLNCLEQEHKVVKASTYRRELENAFQHMAQERSQETSQTGSGIYEA